MTKVDLTGSDEEIRLEIQRLDVEEQMHFEMSQSSEKVLLETLSSVRGLVHRIQKAMEEDNAEEVGACLEQFADSLSDFLNLVPTYMSSLHEANEARLWKDKYEFLLQVGTTIAVGE